MTWWLRKKYIPFALREFKRDRSAHSAHNLATAARLARWFQRQTIRSIKGSDQDREANRALMRVDACWLGAIVSASANGDVPCIVPVQSDAFPAPEALAKLPVELVRELVFGLGAHETMARCAQRAYSRTVGRPRKLRTLGDVSNQHVGNPANGGDRRYERRLRKRAREDETVAAILDEFASARRGRGGESPR